MERQGFSRCTTRNADPTMERLPPVDFSSFQRAVEKLPRQGSCTPWQMHQIILLTSDLRIAAIDDNVLEFAQDRHAGQGTWNLATSS
jgi:hypothetical protein